VEKRKESLKKRMQSLRKELGRPMRLATILVGDDPASAIFVNQKKQMARELGLAFELISLPGRVPKSRLEETLRGLSRNPNVDGIILQLPLPRLFTPFEFIKLIDPHKDVDGLHPANLGELSFAIKEARHSKVGLSSYMGTRVMPASAAGVLAVLEEARVAIEGKVIVLVGFSNLVGVPLSLILGRLKATVVILQEKSPDFSKQLKNADIIISAAGVPKLITFGSVKKGACVIDVATVKTSQGLVGDVDFDKVKTKARLITPVPGGIGPLTVFFLFVNLANLVEKSLQEKKEKFPF